LSILQQLFSNLVMWLTLCVGISARSDWSVSLLGLLGPSTVRWSY